MFEKQKQRLIQKYNKWSALQGKQFKKLGNNVTFGKEIRLFYPENIELGNNVNLLNYTVLATIPEYAGIKHNPLMTIGNNVNTGTQTRIACANRVIIGNNVIMGAFTHITDHSHGYENPDLPISHQPIIFKGPVIIEDDCWLGFGSHVLSGVTIGKHCVIGANSVVTKSIPPYSVAVGNPAKVVKRYNHEKKIWDTVID